MTPEASGIACRRRKPMSSQPSSEALFSAWMSSSRPDADRWVWNLNGIAAAVLLVGVFGFRPPAHFDLAALPPAIPAPFEWSEPERNFSDASAPADAGDPPAEALPGLAPIQLVPVVPGLGGVPLVEQFHPAPTAGISERLPRPGASGAGRPAEISPWRSGGEVGSFPEPGYPAEALKQGWQGQVTLCWTVEPDGQVTEVRVERSSGRPVLDRSAADTVAHRWLFQPGSRRSYRKTFDFKLR